MLLCEGQSFVFLTAETPRVHLTLTHAQWALLILGAFVTGLSKTGIPGLGILSVALFANAIEARLSTGALLPLLLCADIFGVSFYRKHASWPHLWRLFPSVIAGVVVGFLALGRLNSTQIERLMGGIILSMTLLHVWRQRQANALESKIPHTWWVAACAGFLAGFTTMVANAAGPVMILYLLMIGLPKLAFVGTAAWFFMLVNAFKVPFSVQLGLITRESLLLDAMLVLPMVPGALLGPVILKRMNQQAFEAVALALTAAAAIRLLMR